MGACHVSCNQQRISEVENKIGNQGPTLSFSLSTSRMKFQEDPNTDSSPEADAEKDSGATEGKGLRRSPFFAISATCPNLLSILLCPSARLSPSQFTSRCGEWGDRVWALKAQGQTGA